MIQIKDLSFSYDDFLVLNGISFSLSKGAVVGILGPSGCGKTTLLKSIAGVLPNNQSVFIDDSLQANTSFVLQEHALISWKTVFENVAVPFDVTQNLSEDEIAASVKNVLDMVGLTDKKNSYPNELSGGMRQRVSLARALVNTPDVLLLDEPFSSIDMITRQKIMVQLKDILSATLTPTIMVTHYIEEAVYLCDEIHILSATPARIVETIAIPKHASSTDSEINFDLVKRIREQIIEMSK